MRHTLGGPGVHSRPCTAELRPHTSQFTRGNQVPRAASRTPGNFQVPRGRQPSTAPWQARRGNYGPRRSLHTLQGFFFRWFDSTPFWALASNVYQTTDGLFFPRPRLRTHYPRQKCSRRWETRATPSLRLGAALPVLHQTARRRVAHYARSHRRPEWRGANNHSVAVCYCAEGGSLQARVTCHRTHEPSARHSNNPYSHSARRMEEGWKSTDHSPVQGSGDRKTRIKTGPVRCAHAALGSFTTTRGRLLEDRARGGLGHL